MPGYSLKLHRGKWTLDFSDGGRRVRISTGTGDRGLAEARARELWNRRTVAPSERVADLWPRYVQDRIADGVRADRFKAHWTALEPHFGHKIGKAINREDCRAFADARRAQGYAPSTIKTDLELLRACLNWRYADEAPKLWVPPASKPRDRWLTKDEARRLVDATETSHIKLFLTLGLATGRGQARSSI